MGKERPGKTEGFFWIALGVIICLLAWRTHIGSFTEPGAGFIAFAAGLFLSVIGLFMSFSGERSKISHGNGRDSDRAFHMVSWSRLFYTMSLLTGFALLLDTLGYILTALLILWGLFYKRGKNRWFLSFLASLVTVVCSYFMFEVWLKCQLPRGIFPWW